MKAILNDFEKKTLVSALSEFGVINVALHIDSMNSVSYIAFFRKGDYIFSHSLFYSAYKVVNERPSISDFIRHAKEDLKISFKSLRDLLLRPSNPNTANPNYMAYQISQNLYIQQSNFYCVGACDVRFKSVDFESVEARSLKLLVTGSKFENVVSVFFKNFKYNDVLIDRIHNLKKHSFELEE